MFGCFKYMYKRSSHNFSYLFCTQLLQSAIESWSAYVPSMKTSVSRVGPGKKMACLSTPLATTSNMH